MSDELSRSRRNLSRRAVLKGAGRGVVRLGVTGMLLGGLAASFGRGPRLRAIEERSMGILRPPGALEDDDDFLSACLRCELCAQACDAQCILLLGPEEGRHAGTPFILPEEHGCNLCLECTTACPSGALTELSDLEDVAMGIAVVDENLCVSFNGSGACGACHTICPVPGKAIRQGLFDRPTVIAERCVGCGMCTETCPVSERKAIRVETERAWV